MSTNRDNAANNTFSNSEGTFTLSADGKTVTAYWNDGEIENYPVVPEGTEGAIFAPDYIPNAPSIWVMADVD